MITILEVLKLVLDLAKELFPLAKALWRSRKIRRLVGGHLGNNATAAREIELLLAVLQDERLFVGDTQYEPLLKIRTSLWQVYNELLVLVAEARVLSGRDSEETKAAMLLLVAKKGSSALPVLKALVDNPHSEDKARSEALAWVEELKSECRRSALTPPGSHLLGN